MEKEQYEAMYRLEERSWYYRGMRRVMFTLLDEAIRHKRGLKILDAGCGTGINLKALEKYGEAVGVDVSAQAIAFCKKRGCDARKGSVEKLPFDDSSFDLVVCVDVIYHKEVKDDVKALKELERVCKPGGILLLKVPAYKFLFGNQDRATHTQRRYTAAELREKLEFTAFRVKRMTYANTFLFPFIAAKRLLGPKNQGEDADLEAYPVYIEALLLAILRFEAFLIKSFNLPFGVSLFCVARKA